MAPLTPSPPITRPTNPRSKTSNSTKLPSASSDSKRASLSLSNNSSTPVASRSCAWWNSSPPAPRASSASNAKSPPASPLTSPYFPPRTNGLTTSKNPQVSPATPPSTAAPSKAHPSPPSSPGKSFIKCKRKNVVVGLQPSRFQTTQSLRAGASSSFKLDVFRN